jgi:RNA-splicing ligase RtcB
MTIAGAKAVIPNVVGVDISCGMFAIPMPEPLMGDKAFAPFQDKLAQAVPSGFNTHQEPKANLDDDSVVAISDLAFKIGCDRNRVFNSIGTLGSGNHFIEVDEAPDGRQMLVVHSGSRNFGLQIANFHQRRAAAFCQEHFLPAPQGLEYLPMGQGAEEYLADMRIAQFYAKSNRETMVRLLLEAYFGSADLSTGYHCVHNYIEEDGTVRKGAISAKLGEPVVIPLNMRDGIIFGVGKGNASWNLSAPHGAGRSKSRGQARRELQLKDFEDSMKGIWTASVSEDTIDEAPSAYKPKKLILEAVPETVEIEFVARPVYNFKAGGKE